MQCRGRRRLRGDGDDDRAPLARAVADGICSAVFCLMLYYTWPESNVEASHVEKFAAEIRGSHKTIAGFPPDSI